LLYSNQEFFFIAIHPKHQNLQVGKITPQCQDHSWVGDGVRQRIAKDNIRIGSHHRKHGLFRATSGPNDLEVALSGEKTD